MNLVPGFFSNKTTKTKTKKKKKKGNKGKDRYCPPCTYIQYTHLHDRKRKAGSVGVWVGDMPPLVADNLARQVLPAQAP